MEARRNSSCASMSADTQAPCLLTIAIVVIPFLRFPALSASTPGPGRPGGILKPGTRLANCNSILGTAGPPVTVSPKSNGIRLPVYRPPSAHQSNSLGIKGASSLRRWLLVGFSLEMTKTAKCTPCPYIFSGISLPTSRVTGEFLYHFDNCKRSTIGSTH